MSGRKEKERSGGENALALRINGHPVKRSFAEEADTTISQRVRSCLINSFLRRNRKNRKAD